VTMEPDPGAVRVQGMETALQPAPNTTAVNVLTTRLTFEDFWLSEHVSVARALAFTLGDVQLAAEATDEAMARAFQHWARVSTLESPAGWTYRVGLNWSRSVLRRVRRKPPAWLAQQNTHHDAPIIDPSVAAAVKQLPAGQSEVVACRLLLNYSEQQTATLLRIRPGTVKSRLSRAVAQLSTSLAHLDPKEQL